MKEDTWSGSVSWGGYGRSGWRNTGPGTSRSGRTCWPRCVEAGWGNYSLFLTGDGLLVGYLETQDYQVALDRMAATEVNARWQRDMAPYFTELDGLPPDQGFKRVDEIFHVD